MSFNVAQNVDPKEGGDAHVNYAELRRYQQEVDCLSWKPEQARARKSRHELLLALVERMFLHLHQRHSCVEDDEERRRQNELIEKQLPQDNLLGGAWKSPVEPLVPVVENRRVDKRSHDGISTERWLVDLRRRRSLLATKI